MATRYVPKAIFEKDVAEAKGKISKFIEKFYDDKGIGPTFEEIRDGLKIDNDVVACVIKSMLEDDDNNIVKVSA